MKITFKNLGHLSNYTLYGAIVQQEYNQNAEIRENDPMFTGLYLYQYNDGTTIFQDKKYKNLNRAKNAAKGVINKWQ